MIAAIGAVVSFYVAISVTEISQRVTRICNSMKTMLVPEEPKSTPPPPPSRRRTGTVKGPQRDETRRFTKQQLSRPFMDTASWFHGENSISERGSELEECLPNSDESIINMLKVPTENHAASIFDCFFHQISFILRKDSKLSYPDVSERVLSSERVKTAIKTSVMEELKGEGTIKAGIIETQAAHKKRAVHVLHQMRSCISSFLLKIAAWVMFKLLGRMLDGIEIRKDQIENLKKVSKENVPLIYLPLHRSHLDYILVTFILFMNDLRAPLVAAGNNLMIPFFGALLRGLGAFFIKRKLDPQNGQRDFVYRAILHTYMEESLKAGHSLEFFIEGGRSRTGKPVLPKAGLLSIVVDTLMSGKINDAYIVPIAMSYEKLLDGNFVSEQLGRPKKMESFSSAIIAIWRTLHSNYGTVRVDFCQPFSLKEFLLTAEYSYNTPARTLQPCFPLQNQYFCNNNTKVRRISEYGTEIVSEDHRQLIKDLADYIVFSASSVYSLMSTNALAFLLLTKHRKGASFDHLVKSMNWMRDEITKRNKNLNFFGESPELIAKAYSLLGKQLVSVDNIKMEWYSNDVKSRFYEPSVNLPDVLELQYYANAVLPVFLLESVIINAIYASSSLKSHTIPSGDEKCGYVFRSDIIKSSLELCNILQHEFIFSPPGTSICTVLNATIDELFDNSLLKLKPKTESDIDKEKSRSTLPSEETTNFNEHPEMKQELKVNSEDSNSTVEFLRCVLLSFIESYALSASILPKLIDTEMDESTLLQEVKNLGYKKIQLGQIHHEECLGLDTLKNAFKLFESWKIICVRTLRYKKFYSLQPYYNDVFKVEDIISRIEKFNCCI